ncbi:Flp/Fap pilin component superfamily protein [Psychromonas sp. CNPT3]|uniref:Flp family type IVb pilin n=1 Tax=Psychromonas sp. CNPT3 TaxID=314282 RepID=UPI00006E7078|nr:Flp family type IVb pilin [Psychromonas sp. CNPT3]AGH80117.1 Flp/Fap pilin component superfamily protein [Psychromonas sp. CNPT3]
MNNKKINNKSKQRGAAAIEYAILAAAMSIVMFNFLGEDGSLTQAINGTFESVVTKLESIQEK